MSRIYSMPPEIGEAARVLIKDEQGEKMMLIVDKDTKKLMVKVSREKVYPRADSFSPFTEVTIGSIADVMNALEILKQSI